MELTAEYVRSILSYDPDTGEFRWKERPQDHFVDSRRQTLWNLTYSGKMAGHTDRSGYSKIRINKRNFYSHRLAWLYVYGAITRTEIDHINGKKADNRIANLRQATSSENKQNVGLNKRSTTGFKGVHFNKKLHKYHAYIAMNGKQKHLGLFNSAEEAAAAYKDAASKMHGEFARVE